MRPDSKNAGRRRFSLSNTTLQHRFLAAIAVILACSLALGCTLIAGFHCNLQANDGSIARLTAFREVMTAANRLSAERGPTNAVLGEEPTPNSPSQQRLLAFRAASDAALERVSTSASLTEIAAALRQRLALARRQVDALSGLPFSARSNADIERVIEAMFGVFDASQPLIDAAMTNLLADDPVLIGRALVARMLSDLREHAGRMGSHLVIPIAHASPIEPERRAAFEQTRGRVVALWHLAQQQTGAHADPQIGAAHRAVVERFFGEGMPLLERTLDAGRTGQFGLSPAEFTNAIVPSFAPLEQLRDAFLDAAVTQLHVEGAAARRALMMVGAATGLVLLVELSLLAASQTLLFRPLLAARDRIVALAAGKVDEPIAGRGAQGEMRSLFQALDALRLQLIERNGLDRERTALAARLKQQADTDGLTGVLNRGALERLTAHLAETGTTPRRIGLILLDIDRFKAINDAFGHASGDEVLKETALRLRATLRQDDVIARFGGEEFAILLLGQDAEAPVDIAERLRLALQVPHYTLEAGRSLEVTASFGTALIEDRPCAWPKLVAAADRALYRAKAAGRNRVVADGGDA